MQEKKPVFLAPDFDRWLDESDAEMELRQKVLGYRMPFYNRDLSKNCKKSTITAEYILALTNLCLFAQEEKINKISIESRIPKDRKWTVNFPVHIDIFKEVFLKINN